MPTTTEIHDEDVAQQIQRDACRCRLPRLSAKKPMTASIDKEVSPGVCASKLFVCITCRLNNETTDEQEERPGARLIKTLSQLLEAGAPNIVQDIEIVPVECLSNCTRGCTVAVSSPGKWTYVIGALDPAQHAEDVIQFARLHHAHTEGLPVWRERPVHVRKNTIARVPPLARSATRDLETTSQ
jgi:predicted metal-binding protein